MTADAFDYKGFSIPIDLLEKTGAGTDSFDEISRWHIDLIQGHIGIKPTDSVVEIGCGIGRDAIPLTEILAPEGSYFGTDVIQPSIEWCKASITPKFPNFTFEWHNITDDLHNPSGTLKAIDIRLPNPEQSVDLIILQSVFTHMFEAEIVHYLKEFERILKPEGRVWASVFIVDDEILDKVRVSAPTPYALSFRHPYGEGCYINSVESTRGAVAFTRDLIDSMIARAKLFHVKEPLRGSWSGVLPNPEFGQDVLILRT